MLWGLVGLLLGIGIGLVFPLTIPAVFARYTAVALAGVLDAIFGAIKADLQGEYDTTIFISGLLTNMVFAILLTWLGDRLGLDLFLAAVIFFTFRIFQNLATIRYSFLGRFLGKKKVAEKIQEAA